MDETINEILKEIEQNHNAADFYAAFFYMLSGCYFLFNNFISFRL